jgi:membrane-associated phospholipid phosphatase
VCGVCGVPSVDPRSTGYADAVTSAAPLGAARAKGHDHPRRAELRRTVHARGPATAALFVALLALTCGAGFVLTDVLDGSALVRWDVDVEERFEAHRSATWDRLSGWTLLVSDTIPVAVLLVVAIAALAWVTRDWVASVFLALAVGGEKLVYQLSTMVVDRPRPPVSTVGVVHAQSSFPSGHTGSTVSLWGGLAVLAVWAGWVRGRAGRGALVVVVVALAVAVSFARTYRGVHHPTDVVAGVVVGAAALAIAHWAVLAEHPHAGRRHGERLLTEAPLGERPRADAPVPDVALPDVAVPEEPSPR